MAVNSYCQDVSEIILNSNWQFRKVGDTEWLPATVPGTVHTDLLANKKIADPFWGTNEKNLQWIEDADWEYRSVFTVDEKTFNRQNIELEFDGLDTYAKVFLNDSLILSADNMFRTWKANIKKYLKPKDNVLLIHFESAVKRGKEMAKQLPYTLPGDERVFTRKAAYQYGWDWGPRFVTCGIWRPVKITGWDAIRITNVYAEQTFLSDTVAVLNFRLEADCKNAGDYLIAISGDVPAQKSVSLKKGMQQISVEVKIKDPKLWWSNGIGDPHLYKFSCTVSSENKVLDKKNISIGLRNVELIQENDSIGKSFYFKLNGKPVFMKGANWIPADNFLPRVTKEKYRELLMLAKDAGMNMLRVWGGGVYESDDFYSLCDSLGILVWQDFMFANGTYPGNAAFINNVRAEAVDNITRLRNHPCIALWCGNNEIDEGWNNWGWQKQYHYSKNDSIKIWNDYKKIFEQILPGVVDSFFPSPLGKGQGWGAYISTSPLHGWGRKESLTEGDCHYWGVWWGMEPFEKYLEKTGRFMSEYGFQGMPSMNTLRKFCDEKDLSLQSAAVKNHQKHPKGFETIQTYLERDYRQPKDFESYIYVSQLVQAGGMKTAIEEHRRNKPYCMGTLYWQLNDCWPVTSWSSIDYYGNKKALYYVAKKAYTKYNISAPVKDGKLMITAVSDDTADIKARFKIQEIDFTGNHIWSDSGNISISAKAAYPFYTIPMEDLTSNISMKRVFFKFELFKDGTLIADNVFFFAKPKDLILDERQAQYSIRSEAGNILIVLSSGTLLKNVFIDFGDLNVSLSDNFFDLLPNETKTVSVLSNVDIEKLKEKIKITSLVDSYQDEK